MLHTGRRAVLGRAVVSRGGDNSPTTSGFYGFTFMALRWFKQCMQHYALSQHG